MNICLVTPPSVFLLDEKVFMSLGILKVAASLEAAGHQVEHLDLSGVSNYEEVTRIHCQNTKARIFGLTATSPQMPAATKIVTVIRREASGAKIILGGPHVTLVNAASKSGKTKNHRATIELDALSRHYGTLVAGDGEKAVQQAMSSGYQKLYDADDPQSSYWLSSQDFTESPWPARHLVDVDSYHYTIDGERALSMICQLGCLDPATSIMLQSGHELPISDIKKGDLVQCYSVKARKFVGIPVASVWQREANNLWETTWNDGAILRITGEHPVYTPNGWKVIEDIKEGEHVASLIKIKMPQAFTKASDLVWRKLVNKRFIGKSTVFNITVHPIHTYFAAGLLVHNCPFECGFCGGRQSNMLRRIRLRSIDSVIAELEYLYLTYGVKGMMLYDDELNVNKQCIQLMQAIKNLADKNGIEWRLRGFVKAELFNEAQAEAMYAAGFRWLLCGFESGHPKILKNINKKATLEDNGLMLRTAHKYGLKVKALMSIGHPGESEETISATRDWLLQEKPDDFDCTVITTYPGTPYYDSALDIGDDTFCYTFHGDNLYSRDIDFSTEAAYYKGMPGSYQSFVWTDYLSAEQIVSLRDSLEEEVREKLHVPFNSSAAAINYEHSFGMGPLPSQILRGRANDHRNYR